MFQLTSGTSCSSSVKGSALPPQDTSDIYTSFIVALLVDPTFGALGATASPLSGRFCGLHCIIIYIVSSRLAISNSCIVIMSTNPWNKASSSFGTGPLHNIPSSLPYFSFFPCSCTCVRPCHEP
jgi:hypothetical protein